MGKYSVFSSLSKRYHNQNRHMKSERRPKRLENPVCNNESLRSFERASAFASIEIVYWHTLYTVFQLTFPWLISVGFSIFSWRGRVGKNDGQVPRLNGKARTRIEWERVGRAGECFKIEISTFTSVCVRIAHQWKRWTLLSRHLNKKWRTRCD